MAHLEKLKVEKAQQKEIVSSLESSGPILTCDLVVFFTVLEEPFPTNDRWRSSICELNDSVQIHEKLVVYSANSWSQGFYVFYTGKKQIRMIHRLGSCHNLPGLDYLNYRFMGTEMQTFMEYEKICHLCSRNDVKADPEDSSGTCTSSSTDAEGSDEQALSDSSAQMRKSPRSRSTSSTVETYRCQSRSRSTSLAVQTCRFQSSSCKAVHSLTRQQTNQILGTATVSAKHQNKETRSFQTPDVCISAATQGGGSEVTPHVASVLESISTWVREAFAISCNTLSLSRLAYAVVLSYCGIMAFYVDDHVQR